MRPSVLTSLTAVVGASVGAAVMLILKVGANTSCLDLVQRPAPAACAVPAAAPWAVALGAVIGAVLAAIATGLVTRRRR